MHALSAPAYLCADDPDLHYAVRQPELLLLLRHTHHKRNMQHAKHNPQRSKHQRTKNRWAAAIFWHGKL
jgi:hypothetical protein